MQFSLWPILIFQSVRASFSELDMTTGISSSSVGTIQFLKTIRKTVRKSYSQSTAWGDDNSFTIVLSQTIILDSVTFIPSSESCHSIGYETKPGYILFFGGAYGQNTSQNQPKKNPES